MLFSYFNTAVAVVMISLSAHLYAVRRLRHSRARKISHDFGLPGRSLSSMTLKEAYAIIDVLQTLEFPTAFEKARAYALLKVCVT